MEGDEAGQRSADAFTDLDEVGCRLEILTETIDGLQFGVSTFANELGLEAAGDNYFMETPNSGQRVISAGLDNGAGEVVGGALEESNVDTAEEFATSLRDELDFGIEAKNAAAQEVFRKAAYPGGVERQRGEAESDRVGRALHRLFRADRAAWAGASAD